jgi:hypothetical protein
MTHLARAPVPEPGMSPDRPLPTLEWPNDNPPPYWWGKNEVGSLTKVYRSYEDYCDD